MAVYWNGLSDVLGLFSFFLRIHVFRVHEFNVQDILRMCLPYQETMEFAKLASILRIPSNTQFAFLLAHRNPPTLLPRAEMIHKCHHDPSLLSFIHDTVLWYSEENLAYRALVSYAVAITIDVLDRVKNIDAQWTALLVKFVVDGLVSKSLEFRLGGCVIYTYLCARAQIVERVHSRVVELLLSNGSTFEWNEKLLSQVLLCMLHAMKTQQEFPAVFSHETIGSLMEIPQELLFGVLEQLAKEYEIIEFNGRFAISVLQYDLDSAKNRTHEGWSNTLSSNWMKKLPIKDSNTFKQIVSWLFEQYLNHAAIEDDYVTQTIKTWLVEMKQPFPDLLEIYYKEYSVLKKERPNIKDLLDSLAAALFHSSKWEVISNAGISPLDTTALFEAVNAHDKAVRLSAVYKFRELLERDDLKIDDEAEFIRDTILCRLADEDVEIVNAILGLPMLKNFLPSDQLLTLLSKAINMTGVNYRQLIKTLDSIADDDSKKKEAFLILSPKFIASNETVNS